MKRLEDQAYDWAKYGLYRSEFSTDIDCAQQGFIAGHEIAEERYERVINDRDQRASMYNQETDDIIYKQDKKIKELESESNKLKVIIRLRNKIEGLSDILEDLVHWEACPDMYKYRIRKTLELEVDDEDIDDNLFDDNDDILF